MRGITIDLVLPRTRVKDQGITVPVMMTPLQEIIIPADLGIKISIPNRKNGPGLHQDQELHHQDQELRMMTGMPLIKRLMI